MKILGIGTDIVNIKRMDKSLKRYGNKFKNKIFSKNEIIYCEKKRTQARFMLKDLLQKKLLVKLLA